MHDNRSWRLWWASSSLIHHKMIQCNKCQVEKPDTDYGFTNPKNYPGKRRKTCKKCRAVQKKDWAERTGYDPYPSFNAYRVRRKARDPLYKFECHMRSAVRNWITRKNFTKNAKAYDILGCTRESLLKHIENQFVDGMNWENHGEWHVDHIKPLATATTQEEIIKLNHYSNLQPLWAADNITKRDSWHKN